VDQISYSLSFYAQYNIAKHLYPNEGTQTYVYFVLCLEERTMADEYKNGTCLRSLHYLDVLIL